MTAKEYLLKELKGFGTEEEYQPKTVETISVFMEGYAQQQIKELEDDIALEVKTFIKQEQQIKELKEYVIHKPKCDLVGFTAKARHKRECTCGLDKLLNKH